MRGRGRTARTTPRRSLALLTALVASVAATAAPAHAATPPHEEAVPLTRAGDGDYRASGAHRVTLPARLDRAPVRFARDDAWVSFRLRGARGRAAVRGNTVMYARALPGVSLAYAATTNTLKEGLILSGPRSPSVFRFDVAVGESLRPAVRQDGSILLTDARGEPRLAFSSPFMFDSAARPALSRSVGVDLRRVEAGRYVLTLRADRRWLADRERAWPVVLDPTIVDLRPYNVCWPDTGVIDWGICTGHAADGAVVCNVGLETCRADSAVSVCNTSTTGARSCTPLVPPPPSSVTVPSEVTVGSEECIVWVFIFCLVPGGPPTTVDLPVGPITVPLPTVPPIPPAPLPPCTANPASCVPPPPPPPPPPPTPEPPRTCAHDITGGQVANPPAGLPDTGIASTPQDVLGRAEPVVAVDQPTITQLPVHQRYFGDAGRFAPTGDRECHVAVTVGADRVLVSSERYGRVDVFHARDTTWKGRIEGIPGARGIAFYRGEAYVVDDRNRIVVLDPGSDAAGDTPRALRHVLHPAAVVATPPSTVDPRNTVPLVEAVRLTGVDLAWNEIWTTFEGAGGAGGISVLDRATGAPKAVLVHLPRYDCSTNPARLQVGPNDPCETRANGVLVACTPSTAVPPTAAQLVVAADRCRTSVTASFDPARWTWWDLGASPELAGVVGGCRFVNRDPLLGGTGGLSDVSAADVAGWSHCEDGRWQEGIDVVWGMKWLLSANGDAADRPGRRIREYRLKPQNAADTSGATRFDGPVRSWQPMDAASNNRRDVAYQNRELRIDWSGQLKSTSWMRGTRCLDYVVSDADVYVVGHRGELWYELARNFTRIDLLVDGAVKASSITPAGQLCYDTNTVSSGVHELKLIAYANGKTATERQPQHRVDHTAPNGGPDPLPQFVRGTVTVSATQSDGHAGPLDSELRRAPVGGGAAAICPRTAATGQGSRFSCAWSTTNGADGAYDVRAHERDAVAASFGGPNTREPSVRTTVDNTPPTLSLSGELWEARDRAAVYDDEWQGLDAIAGDATSGVQSVTVSVGGVERGRAQAGCPDAGNGCTLLFDLYPRDYVDGTHEVRVVARDRAGNERTATWTVTTRHDVPEGSGATAMSASLAALPGLSAPEGDILPCTVEGTPANFPFYAAGSSFQGITLVDVTRRCDLPYPGEPGRANYVSYVYGTCSYAVGAEACQPPLEIQSWPSCERSFGDYDPLSVVSYQATTILGAPAGKFDGGLSIEIYTNKTTIVVFGTDALRVDAAARAVTEQATLETSETLDQATGGATRALPPAGRDVLDGKVPCNV